MSATIDPRCQRPQEGSATRECEKEFETEKDEVQSQRRVDSIDHCVYNRSTLDPAFMFLSKIRVMSRVCGEKYSQTVVLVWCLQLVRAPQR